MLAIGACGGGGADGVQVDADGVDDGDELHEDGADDVRDEVAAPVCVGERGMTAGSDRLTSPLGTASVAIAGRDTCARTYTLSSSAARRDDLPASPRVLVEGATDPILRSGHDLFDAAYALAIAEAHEASVASIRDGAFGGGAETACGGAAGCWETGRKWTYVWTRDTAFALDLGLAALDPARSAGSLRFKLSPRREGGPAYIVQDTGSGGSWPVSSDRVAWALGARATLAQLTGAERTAFRDEAFAALTTTLAHDRATIYDAASGLYRGETSFLDWREQSYPGWTQHDTSDIAMSAALGTNVLHMAAMRIAAELATEVGDPRAAELNGWADALAAAIRTRFSLPGEDLLASFVPTTLDPAPVGRFDLLSSALAILHDVVSPAQATQILSAYPHYGRAAPVIWPQQQHTRIYHNRADWPFVSAYWLAAAHKAKHVAVSERMARAMFTGAVLNLSNMESFEAQSGAPWLEDGTASGPVVNSQRQLWSIGGYLRMVHGVLFGLAATRDGLAVEPWLTAGLRRELFGGTDRLVLARVPHRGRRLDVVLTLPSGDAAGEAYRVASRAVDGVPVAGREIPDALLRDGARIDVVLEPDPDVVASSVRVADGADWRAIYGPRTPQIRGIDAIGGKLTLTLGLGDESPDGLALTILRDGVRVAEGLPGTTTTWVDPDSDANAPRSPCYTVEARFVASGNRSQHARASCWWGVDDAAIQIVPAERFEAVGGAPSDANGRFHHAGWGEPGHSLTLRGLTPVRSGPHLLQVAYANGHGPLDTGVGCGIKRVTVIDEGSGATVAEGLLVMPQLGRWDRWALSTFVAATLSAGATYRVVISADTETFNMSDLAHFTRYAAGAYTHIDIAELRLLAR